MFAFQITIHHDWLDYLGAVGGFAGGIAGLVALLFAALSKRDAERSANAAEEALEIMRLEAEAARAERERLADPILDLRAAAFETTDDRPPGFVVLELHLWNEGTLAAERLIVNFFVPELLSLMGCADEFGNIPGGTGEIRTDTDAELGEYVGVKCWIRELDALVVNVRTVGYLRISRPPAGTYLFVGRLVHPDVPGGSRDRAWNLNVPDHGDKITLEDVTAMVQEHAEKPS